MLRELRERIRYALDELFAREIAGQVALFLGLVAAVTLIGTTAVFFGLFDQDNALVESIPREIDQGFFDALWWSLQLVLNLQGLGQTYGATWPIVVYALVLSLSSLAAFAILISLVRTIIARRLESLRQGDTRVKERDHIVLLYWTHKTIPALRQIARLRPGSRVAVLAPLSVSDMQESLRLAGVYRLPVKVILRSGTPSNADELNRVAANRASSVVIFSPDSSTEVARSDSEVIKTMMLLAGKTDWPAQRPTLLAEIDTAHNLELASLAGRGEFLIVASSTVISKVIVQCIRNPGLSAVYRELFDTSGNSIHIEKVPGFVGENLGELTRRLNGALPMGVTWQEATRTAASLNPEPDYEIDDDDEVIVLALAPGRVQLNAELPVQVAEVRASGGRSARTPAAVLIIGWSGELYDVLSELDAHALSGSEITVLSGMDETEAQERVTSVINAPLQNVTVSYKSADPIERRAYQTLDMEGFNSIVVLADDTSESEDVDAYTLRVALRLFELFKDAVARPHTVVEITDEVNRPLFDTLAVDDVVASSDIVSGELAQTARQPVLAAVYSELLRAGGVEISLRPVRAYLPEVSHCRFDDLVVAAQTNLETALGVMHESGTLLNPSRSTRWEVTDDMMLVVLAQQVYR